MQFLSECDIIERYFIQKKSHSSQIVRGIGDDAAVLSIPAGYEWVTTVDTLNEDVHFFSNANAYDDTLLSRLLRPTPRVALGLSLQGLATSAMDISDGLLMDLMKLCKASHVGARVEAALLPLSSMLKMQNRRDAWEWALTALGMKQCHTRSRIDCVWFTRPNASGFPLRRWCT